MIEHLVSDSFTTWITVLLALFFAEMWRRERERCEREMWRARCRHPQWIATDETGKDGTPVEQCEVCGIKRFVR